MAYSCVSRRIGVLLLPLAVCSWPAATWLAGPPDRPRADRRMDPQLSPDRRRRSADRQHQRARSRSRASTGRRSRSRPSGLPGRATDAAARELLPRIDIKEDIKPDRVSLETERMSGIMIGAAFEVRYHVRAPKNAVVNVDQHQRTVALDRADRQGHGARRPTAASTARTSPAASTRDRPTAA